MAKQKIDIKWAGVQDENTQDYLLASLQGKSQVRVYQIGFEDMIPWSSACGLADGLRSIGVFAYYRKRRLVPNNALFVFSKDALPNVIKKAALDFIEDTL